MVKLPSLKRRKQAPELDPGRKAGVQSNGNYSADTNLAVAFNPNRLFVGQVLWIGCKQHTVEYGQTARGIANKYGVTVDYLIESNTYVGTEAIRLHPEPLTIVEWP